MNLRILLSALILLTGSLCVVHAADKPTGSPLFRPPQSPAVPPVKDKQRDVNPIDAFVLAELEKKSLSANPRADKLRLMRRVTFDLTGLPPALDEQEAFLTDDSPDAYKKVVERLLASPHYGERWAQHWLDLVRYAETDGFKADDLRPEAYRYRDYVIRALNADLPYDRFIKQQLAGDELEPDNLDAIIATGFNRLWPDEYNAANLEQRRQEILDDMTDTTGFVFLGLTIGCARCHDHKFDPTLQKDYFRLQAFFTGFKQRDDVPAVNEATRQQVEAQLNAWEDATKDIRTEMDTLVAAKVTEIRKHNLEKFRPEILECVNTPPEKRTPYQWQIALMAEKQAGTKGLTKGVIDKLPEDKKKRYKELEKELAAFESRKPAALPAVMSISDLGCEAAPVHLLQGGDWRKPTELLRPGFPEFLGGGKVDTSLPEGVVSTGLRAALARWLTRKDHPLTARVMVNRLWQHHFGVGLVATPSDFGALGDAPTHPELLDWLAVEFVEHGWSLKHMHRLMVTSAAYCQDSSVDPRNPKHEKALAADRENKLLWHANRRRLEGEALRDAMLVLSGELNPRMYGMSARPKLPEKISNYAWKPDAKIEDQNRRSIYVFVKRNMRYPLFDAFDWPDLHNSCGRRVVTTTAPQALLLLNGDFTKERADKLSADLLAKYRTDDTILVAQGYRRAWSRPATTDETELGVRFINKQTTLLEAKHGNNARAQAVADFCHALLNANEFLYVD
jgi:Protein of unknown function (DUF1553)/Protein of unknown function (DUF1549)